MMQHHSRPFIPIQQFMIGILHKHHAQLWNAAPLNLGRHISAVAAVVHSCVNRANRQALTFWPCLKQNSRIAILVTVMLSLATHTTGQLARNSQEVWPAIDAYLRFNQKWRLYATSAATKKDGSSYSDAAIGVFGDYFASPVGFATKIMPNRADSLPGKFLWLRAGYQYSATPPSSEDPFKESMLVTEANPRFYLPYGMLLTIKNRFDWRFNEGNFNARYRPRLMIEKDMHTEYLFFTATGFLEYYANFGSGSVNRLKSQIGIELRVFKRMNYEVYWNHQFANEPEIQSVDAFGMTLKLYLDKKDFNLKKKCAERKAAKAAKAAKK
jgi:hypothetical protein